MEPEPEGRGGGGDSADTSTSLSTLNSSTLYSLAEVPTRLQPKDSAPGTQRFGAGDKKCAPAIHALGCARPCSCSAPTCAHRPRSAGCAPALILPPVRGVRCAPPLWGPNRDPQTAAKRNGDPASAARLSDRAGGVSLRFCGRGPSPSPVPPALHPGWREPALLRPAPSRRALRPVCRCSAGARGPWSKGTALSTTP